MDSLIVAVGPQDLAWMNQCPQAGGTDCGH
jgi:hypothetical protein